MKKILFGLCILLMGISCCNGKAINAKEPAFKKDTIVQENLEGKTRLFVGYINQIPVFDFPTLNSLFIYDTTFELVYKYNPNYNVLHVGDSIICFKEDDHLIIQRGKVGEQQHKLNSESPFVASNGREVFYTDIKTFEIKKVVKESTIGTGIIGVVIDVDDKYLYYSKESDPNIMYANVDIFRVDIHSFEEVKIAVDVAGEYSCIIPNNKYIYDNKLIEGGFEPVLFDYANNTYSRINLVLEDYVSKPFYSYKRNCIVFYNSDYELFKYVELPE